MDHSTPHMVAFHMADRMAEMQARRLAAEARAGSPRTYWLTGEIRSAVNSSAALVARLRHVHVGPGPRLASGHDQA
jgi:hypothetical protein